VEEVEVKELTVGCDVIIRGKIVRIHPTTGAVDLDIPPVPGRTDPVRLVRLNPGHLEKVEAPISAATQQPKKPSKAGSILGI